MEFNDKPNIDSELIENNIKIEKEDKIFKLNISENVDLDDYKKVVNNKNISEIDIDEFVNTKYRYINNYNYYVNILEFF